MRFESPRPDENTRPARRWRSTRPIALLLLPLALVACDDPLPPEPNENEVEVGDYQLTLTTLPDHIHEGDAATVRVTVVNDSGDTPQPVTGLSPELHVIEADASEFTYDGPAVTEPEDGVYEIAHTFGSAGDAAVEFHFTGSSGPAEAEFTVEVSEAHEE